MGVAEYRQLPHINYSSCKDFDESRTKFYKKYILKEPVEEKKSYSITFGDLAHCLLLNPEDFDSKFARLGVGVTPKPQMKEFADNLWELTKACMTEDRQVTRKMDSLMEEAFSMTAYSKNGERVAFKGKTIDYVLLKFEEEGELYYRSKRENYGKEVVDARTYEFASRCVDELKSNPVTKHIVTAKTDKRYTVYNEYAIVFTYSDQKLKALCDKLIIDHTEKKIYIYDLKSSGWDIGTFDQNILRNRFYLQWALYFQAVKAWASEQGMKEYEIVPMQFIVVSSDMSENPLIYTTTNKDVHYGMSGFTRNGKVHKGLDQIITEIVWHTSYAVWNMSYTDYQNKGIKRVSLFEES